MRLPPEAWPMIAAFVVLYLAGCLAIFGRRPPD
jgi:hypothetical protein